MGVNPEEQGDTSPSDFARWKTQYHQLVSLTNWSKILFTLKSEEKMRRASREFVHFQLQLQNVCPPPHNQLDELIPPITTLCSLRFIYFKLGNLAHPQLHSWVRPWLKTCGTTSWSDSEACLFLSNDYLFCLSIYMIYSAIFKVTFAWMANWAGGAVVLAPLQLRLPFLQD